jgi:hypothetical protein
MSNIVDHLESRVGHLSLPTPGDVAQRQGAITPADERLSRPLGAIGILHKKVEKICCIGAGYVGRFSPSSTRGAVVNFVLQFGRRKKRL